MGEEPTFVARAPQARPTPPPAPLVHDAIAALRAADVHVRVLCDRLDLARSGHIRLDRVPAELLVQLVAIAAALETGVDAALERIDPDLAANAQMLASLARAAPRDYDDRCE